MSTLNRIMSYDKTKESQTVKIPKLSDEEINEIISEKYSDKDEKTKEFIQDALRVHGDRYDYSESVYVKYHKKLKIICNEELHGVFLQTPAKHIYGEHGCCICAGTSSNAQIFIYKACQIKTNYLDYDYTRITYINNTTPIMIFCKNCNRFFWQNHTIILTVRVVKIVIVIYQ